MRHCERALLRGPLSGVSRDARSAHYGSAGPGGGCGYPVPAGEQGEAGLLRGDQERPVQAPGGARRRAGAAL